MFGVVLLERWYRVDGRGVPRGERVGGDLRQGEEFIAVDGAGAVLYTSTL